MPMAVLALHLTAVSSRNTPRAWVCGTSPRSSTGSSGWLSAQRLGKLAFAPSRHAFVRRAWLDLLIIVLSPPFLVPNASRAQGPSAPSAFCVSFGLCGLRLLRRLA